MVAPACGIRNAGRAGAHHVGLLVARLHRRACRRVLAGGCATLAVLRHWSCVAAMRRTRARCGTGRTGAHRRHAAAPIRLKGTLGAGLRRPPRRSTATTSCDGHVSDTAYSCSGGEIRPTQPLLPTWSCQTRQAVLVSSAASRNAFAPPPSPVPTGTHHRL